MQKHLGREGFQGNKSLLCCSSLPGNNAFCGLQTGECLNLKSGLFPSAHTFPPSFMYIAEACTEIHFNPTENPRVFWPGSTFYVYEGSHKQRHIQWCIRSFGSARTALASDFVYVNKSRIVAHLCRHNQRKN